MMGRIEGVPDTVIELALAVLAISIVLAFVRLVRGPSLLKCSLDRQWTAYPVLAQAQGELGERRP